MCMFNIIVNIETALNGWNVYEVVTTRGRQVNIQTRCFNGWWWMFDNGFETTCTCFSRQKDCDSFACLCFFLVMFH